LTRLAASYSCDVPELISVAVQELLAAPRAPCDATDHEAGAPTARRATTPLAKSLEKGSIMRSVETDRADDTFDGDFDEQDDLDTEPIIAKP
jgi:hypothetical protein